MTRPKSPAGAISDRIRDRARRDDADLRADPAVVDRYLRDELRQYAEAALGGRAPMLADEDAVAQEVSASLTGMGPIQPYLDDPRIEEIWVNAPDRIFVAHDGISEQLPLALTAEDIRDLLDRLLHQTGRRIDISSPFVDAALPDGSRLHAVIPDISRAHVSINIRRFRTGMRTLADLVRLGMLTAQAAGFLHISVRAGLNILIAGATHTGKTTLLGALLGACVPEDRIVTVEETFELALTARDHVALQCRQPSLEGTGEITLRRLIKESLRMRPERLVVGEVREAEALDLLIALNSGVPGMCSIHAGSAPDALMKLCTLPLLAGRNIDSAFVTPTVAATVDLVVFLERGRSGERAVAEIIAPTGRIADGSVEAVTLFERVDGELASTGTPPPRLTRYRRAAIDPLPVLRERSARTV
ncbi:CpaF family protein [Homoserinibacter sp. GY 40078]|uniref:CpaF family protein n=1 Tax=Homoserinibacter sp. GY 40078 TaxID=2603275 RepID=UPI0011C77C3D|nr:ATPase, T2SS/T4P/T4SS family [Homoserinibacter sp. GY 40078]TXK19785.1 CpaF family protein [Homoserinibacter sp. GY 40078]